MIKDIFVNSFVKAMGKTVGCILTIGLGWRIYNIATTKLNINYDEFIQKTHENIDIRVKLLFDELQ